MASDSPTPPKGVPAFVEPKKAAPCDRKDCPRIERRRRTDRFQPYVDIGKIAALIGMTHLILRLVILLGTLTPEVLKQTHLLQDIHDHFHHLAGGK